MTQQDKPKLKHKRIGKLTAINPEETLGTYYRLELSKGGWELKKRSLQHNTPASP